MVDTNGQNPNVNQLPNQNQNKKQKWTSSDDMGFPEKSYEDDLDETERRQKTQQEIRQSTHRF